MADAITQEDRDRVALDTHNYFNSQKSGRLIFLLLYINVYIYISRERERERERERVRGLDTI